MNIQSVSPNFTGNLIHRVSPLYRKNKGNQYLYNQVIDIVKEAKTPAVVSNKGIDLMDPSKAVLDALEAKGIQSKILI